MKLLTGKVAIVTGAARGIGAAIALKLAAQGSHIAFTYVSDSSEEKANSLVAEIEKLGVKAKAYKANAADFAAMYQSSQQTITAEPVSWHFSYELRPDSLRYQDPVPLLLHLLMEVPGLRPHSGKIYTIFFGLLFKSIVSIVDIQFITCFKTFVITYFTNVYIQKPIVINIDHGNAG